MKTLRMLVLALIASSSFMLHSCDKEQNDSTSGMQVRLTDYNDGKLFKSSDGKLLFEEVNIDIERVSVHYGDTNSNGDWVNLPTNAGIYDLVELNNVTVVIADTNGLPPGYISQIRLILGDDNTVVIDSVSYELKTPSAQQSGLKMNMDFNFQPGARYEVLLNFDAEESIVVQGNGGFLLKPVLRVESIIEMEP